MVLCYLFYDCGTLLQENKTISRKLEGAMQHLAVIKKDIEHMPLCYDQAVQIKKLIESSLAQQERLWRFVETLPDVLGEDVRLQTLLMGPEKACFSLESQDALVDVREVVHHWEKILPDHPVLVVEAEHGEAEIRAVGGEDHREPLVLECISPLKEVSY